MTELELERAKAVYQVLVVLRNPLRMMSIPDREEAAMLAVKHNITALDLLGIARRAAEST